MKIPAFSEVRFLLRTTVALRTLGLEFFQKFVAELSHLVVSPSNTWAATQKEDIIKKTDPCFIFTAAGECLLIEARKRRAWFGTRLGYSLSTKQRLFNVYFVTTPP